MKMYKLPLMAFAIFACVGNYANSAVFNQTVNCGADKTACGKKSGTLVVNNFYGGGVTAPNGGCIDTVKSPCAAKKVKKVQYVEQPVRYVAAPTPVARPNYDEYAVAYEPAPVRRAEPRDSGEKDWYISARVALNFLNWKNEYYTDYRGFPHEDKYSFEAIVGGNIAVGHIFGNGWRGELELGYSGQFTDQDEGFKFKLGVPYAMANALYDFENGVYLGAGIGAAMPTTTWEGDAFLGGDGTKSVISPIGGLMLGYAHPIAENTVIDLRYRISGTFGGKHTRSFEDWENNLYTFETEIGLILENQISAGIRYRF